MAVFKEIMHIYSTHYPEIMGKCLVVHPPVIMSAVWKVLQLIPGPPGFHTCTR